MNVIDMFEYEGSSYRRQLKDLYRILDETNLSYEVGIEKRRQFFRRMRGRFLQVSRLKRDVPVDQILDFLKIPLNSLPDIENGNADLKDREFFQFVTFLGCAHETPIFLEKIEKAMTPGLREARKEIASTLGMFGFCFADSDEK